MVPRGLRAGEGARLVPWAVLIVGLITTAVLNESIGRSAFRRDERDFRVAKNRVVDEINSAVTAQVSVLQAVAGLVAAKPDVTQPEFSAFYRELQVEGAAMPQGLGLSLSKPWSKRNELAIEAVRRKVKGLDLRPPGPREEAHAVMLIEPQDERNRVAPGYDMFADPIRQAAMRLARKTRKVAMTSRVFLAKDAALAHPPPSFVFFLPVAQGEANGMQGYVFSAIHAKDLFTNVFPGEQDSTSQEHLMKGLGVRLWSGPRRPENLVFEHSFDPSERIHESNGPIALKSVGQTLDAEFVATREFGTRTVVRQYVVPFGTLISIMLFLLAFGLRRAKEASDRRAAEQWLLGEVGRRTAAGAEEEATLKSIAQDSAKICNAECRIDIFSTNGQLRTVGTRTEGLDEAQAIEREYPRLEFDPLLRAAIDTGKTQKTDRVSLPNEALAARIAPFDLGPIAVVPMVVQNRVIGAVTLSRRRSERALSDSAVALIEAIAGQIALSIENSRLYQAAQNEIVERRAAEDEVRRLNEGLGEMVAEQTRDLKASNQELESFCYSVSHDLRTPLRSIDGFGRALKEDYGDSLDAQALDYIDRIRAGAKRMDELITALLTLSRLTRREILPTKVDITTMVRDLMHDLDPQGKVELEVDERVTVQADPRMLSVVLENLLSNAIKFSANASPPRITVGSSEEGAFFVRDNGAGFEMAYANKLFLPFERLHSVREFPGHGIGLATVERIVRRHGGDVRAEGKPGDGATFFVKFPS